MQHEKPCQTNIVKRFSTTIDSLFHMQITENSLELDQIEMKTTLFYSLCRSNELNEYLIFKTANDS